MRTEFNYELESPIEYASKGEQHEAGFITLQAPTSRNLTECAQLKQAFFRALPKTPANTEVELPEEGDAELDGPGVMLLIAMSTEVELATVLCIARELFSSGLAQVDGEEKLTKTLLDKMSQDDLENMTGAYLANFILASALQKLKQSS
jgi:hypothetical protein